MVRAGSLSWNPMLIVCSSRLAVLVLGKMVDNTVENGGMVWPMEKVSKPTPMEIFVTKDSGLMMNQCARDLDPTERKKRSCAAVSSCTPYKIE